MSKRFIEKSWVFAMLLVMGLAMAVVAVTQ
jgi:hypothetical protein